jgi:hypothetical protein
MPRQRTCGDYFSMSVSCHNRTHAPQQTGLLNHLVSPSNDQRWDYEPRALAALRLMTSSNFVGPTGRSAGLAPPEAVLIADRSRQPLNSLTSRLNFSGFSMNMKCAPPSFSSKISVFAPLICFPIQT